MTAKGQWLLSVLRATPRGKALSPENKTIANLVEKLLPEIEDEVRARTLAIVEDHWPQIGVDQSDSTWLYCDCGWDQSEPRAVSWFDHLEAAFKQAFDGKSDGN